MKKVVKVGLIIFAVVVDILVYVFLGIALMNYDDFYNGPQEKYGDWDTMPPFDKYIFIGWLIWNLVNLVVILYLAGLVVMKLRRRKQ